MHIVFSQNTNISMSRNSVNTSDVNGTVIDLVQDPSFTLLGKDINFSSYWSDPEKSCLGLFTCHLNLTDGLIDNQSFQLSTTNGTDKHWSWIFGKEIEVKPTQQYQFLTHMKLNQMATLSHIPLAAYNESSQTWYQIWQCPSGTNGSLAWKEFDCKITIPNNITKIRPTLNAGWSSQEGGGAVTSFDEIHLYQIK